MSRPGSLKEMKESIGTKDPVVFFDKLTDTIAILFDRIDQLEITLHNVKTCSALAVHWDPKIASDLLVKQVNVLRPEKDTYFAEITALKNAVSEDKITQEYGAFCAFWQETLGWHPFLD
jgi:hypothetical protein